MSGHVIAQIISISLAPVVTRLFEPEVFGTAALYQSIASVLVVFACLRYELAIVIAEKDEDADRIVALCFYVVVTVSLISFFLVFGFRNPLSCVLNSPSMASYLWLIPISVMVRGMSLIFANWNTRHKNFGYLASSRVAASLGLQSARIGTGFMGWTSAGMLILSAIIGNTLTCLTLGWKTIGQRTRLIKNAMSMRDTLAIAETHRKFPLLNTWSACISVISLELPNWFFASFFSPTVVGYYALARTTLMIPMIMVGRALSRVFYQKASELHQRDNTPGVAAVKLFRSLFTIGIPPTLALCFWGQDAFVLIFSRRWAEAGLYVQILSFWMFFQFLFSPLSFLLYVLQRQDLYLLFEAILLVLRFLALLGGAATGSMIQALILYSVVNAAFTMYLIAKIFSLMNINIILEIKPILKYVLLSFVIFAGLFFIKHFLPIHTYLLFFLLLISCSFYYGLLYRSRHFNLSVSG
jgi:O-antigen/teichoic acid export membrane protein